MRRTARLLVFAGLVAFASCAAAETARVARPGAELRDAPGFAGPVTLSPPEGSLVEVLERRNEWTHVRAAEGKEGWIHEVFLATAGSGAVAPPPAAPERPAAEAPKAAAKPASSAAPEPADAASLEARVAQLGSELLQLQAQNDYLTGKLAAMTTSQDALQDRIAEVLADRDAARKTAQGASEQADAAVAAARAQGLEAGREEAREEALKEIRSEPAERQRIEAARADEREKVRAQHAQALADAEARRLKDVADADARHEAVMQQFIDVVTKKHDDALARETDAIETDCEQRLVDLRRQHEKELKVARKESGWEQDFQKEVRARLDMEIEEAKTRWEAKQRGEMYDVERARKEEAEKVRKQCEGERLVAVNEALVRGQAEMSEALARERQEADNRCQVALELVLEHVAEGGEATKVRQLAETAAHRRSGDAGATSTPAQGEGAAVPPSRAQPAPAEPVAPVSDGHPVPVPVPWSAIAPSGPTGATSQAPAPAPPSSHP